MVVVVGVMSVAYPANPQSTVVVDVVVGAIVLVVVVVVGVMSIT